SVPAGIVTGVVKAPVASVGTSSTVATTVPDASRTSTVTVELSVYPSPVTSVASPATTVLGSTVTLGSMAAASTVSGVSASVPVVSSMPTTTYSPGTVPTGTVIGVVKPPSPSVSTSVREAT